MCQLVPFCDWSQFSCCCPRVEDSYYYYLVKPLWQSWQQMEPLLRARIPLFHSIVSVVSESLSQTPNNVNFFPNDYRKHTRPISVLPDSEDPTNSWHNYPRSDLALCTWVIVTAGILPGIRGYYCSGHRLPASLWNSTSAVEQLPSQWSNMAEPVCGYQI